MKKALCLSLMFVPLVAIAQVAPPAETSFWEQLKSFGIMAAIYGSVASILFVLANTMIAKGGIFTTIGNIIKSIIEVFSSNLKH